METDWFKLVGARLQMRPYQRPFPEVAVAAQVSPAGPRAAGRFGCSLLSIGATSAGRVRRPRPPLGRDGGAGGRVRHHGRPRQLAPGRARCTSPTPRSRPSPTSSFGLEEWVDYFQRVAALPLAPDTTNFASLVDALNASGFAVIGTVEDAIAQMRAPA